MCATKTLKYIPEVVARSKRPGSAAQNLILNNIGPPETSIGKNEKKISQATKAGKATVATIDHDTEPDLNLDTLELPPKSFVIKEPIEYFKPKIHVEMENPDKLDTVTEIHIKGWKIEKPLIEVLSLCIPSSEQLNTLNLWNVGLDEEAVRLIVSMLPSCTNLKTLILDGNPIPTHIYEILIYEENSNVQNLSLRNNQLDDDAVNFISYALGDIRRQNSKLLTLNLSSNKISDAGAIYLARALRTNRTLLSLNLAQNTIGDVGAKALADVISRFPLTFAEIVYRRYIMSGRSFEKSASPSGRRKNDSKERPSSQKSNAHVNIGDSKSKKKDPSGKKSNEGVANLGGTNSSLSNTKNKDAPKVKKDEKGGRKASIADNKNAKTIKPTSKTGKRQNKETEEVNAALLELSALTDIADYANETLYLTGNKVLLSLNLSRNELTDQSLSYFLAALQYQKQFMEVRAKIQPVQGTGILRLVLNRNKITSQSEVNSYKLYELLKQRDPLSKSTYNTNNPDADTVSVQSGKESSLGRNQKMSAKH